jgi:hypothetical protein
MKRKNIALVLLLSLAIVTAACGGTTQKKIVKNEKKDQLEQMVSKQGNLSELLPSEPGWEEELTSSDESVKVHVNAAIQTSEVTELPIVSCKPRYFTLDEVKNIIDLLYGDAALYRDQTDQEWLEAEIKMQKEELSYLKEHGKYTKESGALVVDGVENEIASQEARIADLEKEYQAVSAGPVEVKDIAFTDNGSTGEALMLRDDQETPMTFFAYNDSVSGDGAGMEYAAQGFDLDSSGKLLADGEELEIAISREEAKQKALDTAKACGISEDCQVVMTEEAQINGQSSYVFRLVRLIGGVPNTQVSSFVTASRVAEGDGGEAYTQAWNQESIAVAVNDKGIVGFSWKLPPEIIDTVNDNVAIQSFEEIKEVARTILPMQLEIEEMSPERKDVTIYEVRLNMMRVSRQDKEDAYYYVPVWDFMGYHGDVSEEKTSYLTLNALDGSVIDRGVGH